jgi:glycosyltransferase involved in cell wall biosynthesis
VIVRVAVHAGQLLQPVPGGIGRYTQALLARLPAAGADAVAFAAGARPSALPASVPWIDLGWPHGSLRYELWHRVRRPAVPVDADIVHAPSLAIPPTQGPLVVTVHDIAFCRLPDVTTRRGVSFHTRGLAIARASADLVLAPSAFTRAELLREGFEEDSVLVTPLGVDLPRDRTDDELDAVLASLHVEQPYVLTVGTVEPRKDLPTIARAVGVLRRSHRDLGLVVVGPPGWGEVTGLDRPGVRVLGQLPWAVVDALYRRATVCCIASRYEGFGLPALEALARGAPVVVADGSALTEVVADAGLVFAPGAVDELVEHLRQVIDDVDLRAELSGRGRRRAAELTWDASARRHVETFHLAIERHRERA